MKKSTFHNISLLLCQLRYISNIFFYTRLSSILNFTDIDGVEEILMVIIKFLANYFSIPY